jgi:hypothetical protein
MITTATGMRAALTLAVAATVALSTACDRPGAASHEYVVQSVEPSSAGAADGLVVVTCASTKNPADTKTVQWDGSAQPPPVVGSEWPNCEDG